MGILLRNTQLGQLESFGETQLALLVLLLQTRDQLGQLVLVLFSWVSWYKVEKFSVGQLGQLVQLVLYGIQFSSVSW